MKKIKLNLKYRKILKFAKSKGYLSPLWLLPHSEPQTVKTAFEELNQFLVTSFRDGQLRHVNLKDIQGFMWSLKRNFAFEGWDGIAPFLLTRQPRPLLDLKSKLLN